MCINPCILYIIAARMAAINTPPFLLLFLHSILPLYILTSPISLRYVYPTFFFSRSISSISSCYYKFSYRDAHTEILRWAGVSSSCQDLFSLIFSNPETLNSIEIYISSSLPFFPPTELCSNYTPKKSHRIIKIKEKMKKDQEEINFKKKSPLDSHVIHTKKEA